MKRTILIGLLFIMTWQASAYNDHRGYNLDSLERVVARWTPDAVDRASEEELLALNRACRDLMRGYVQLNGEKSLFYARKALSISQQQGWIYADADACRYIGQLFYGREQFDSALVYYSRSMECVQQMTAGAVSVTSPDGYTEKEIDDQLSVLYGSLGNVYNLMDSIPRAMEYYDKASVIFDKYGWNESNSVLYYNLGETWVEESEMDKARKAYGQSLDYALAAGDSLLTANARKGLGRLYMEEGRPWKALCFLHQADAYYSAHAKEEPVFAKENFEYMSIALEQQRKMLSWMIAGLLLLFALAASVFLAVRRLRRSRREQAGTAAVMQETRQEIKQVPPSDIRLSPREKDILDLLSKGYTAPDIAQALGLSYETIRWYRKKLIAKLDVANTAELISSAKDQGLI